MRLPLVRFTVRRMMAAVAVLALFFGILEREFRFQRLAEYHFLRAFPSIGADDHGGMLVTSDGEKTVWVEAATGTPITRARARWHEILQDKYRKAARYPWLPIDPDPPKPK
jgi:hypothetical protein